MQKRYTGEKGAMIVQAAVATIAFLALTALAVDFGVKLIARTEAQRSADAGALAAAVSAAFDGTPDLTDAGAPKRNARGFALANTVFGEAPNVNISTDVQFVPCPVPDPVGTCVRVDVYRNQERSNPLPTFFSRLVGVEEQGVKATATAKILQADTSECLRPWAVIDRWDEFLAPERDFPGTDPDWCQGGPCGAPSTYDKYSTKKDPPQEDDYYVPPATDGTSPGTGFRAIGTGNDIGRQFALKVQSNDSVSSGWGLALDLPRADTQQMGADTYRANIRSCSRKPVTINQPSDPCPADLTGAGYAEVVDWAAKGCVRVQTGTMQGPTDQGIDDLVALDPNAKWGWNTETQAYGVIDSDFAESPRIVPVAIFDIDSYLATNPTGAGGVARIVNILGFFIEGMGDFNDKNGAITLKNGGKAVIGRLMKIAGSKGGTVQLSETASFSRIIVLVR